MKVLIMLSGGVESTALLHYAKECNYEVECVHVIWNNKTQREANHAARIADYYGVPYSELNMKSGEFQGKYHNVARRDSLWWGCGLLTYAPIGGYNEVWYGAHCDEISPVALGPAGVTLLLRSVNCDTDVKCPMFHMSKVDQWNTLPQEVKKLLVTCNNPGKDGKPCGICEKCIEWKSFAINAQ